MIVTILHTGETLIIAEMLLPTGETITDITTIDDREMIVLIVTNDMVHRMIDENPGPSPYYQVNNNSYSQRG